MYPGGDTNPNIDDGSGHSINCVPPPADMNNPGSLYYWKIIPQPKK